MHRFNSKPDCKWQNICRLHFVWQTISFVISIWKNMCQRSCGLARVYKQVFDLSVYIICLFLNNVAFFFILSLLLFIPIILKTLYCVAYRFFFYRKVTFFICRRIFISVFVYWKQTLFSYNIFSGFTEKLLPFCLNMCAFYRSVRIKF